MMLLWMMGCEQPVLCWDGSELGDTGCPAYTDTAQPLEPVTIEPVLSIDDVVPTLDVLLTEHMPDLQDLRVVFSDVLAGIDNNCPGQEGTVFGLLEPCTSSSGYTYYGVSTWATAEREMDGVHEYFYGSGLTSLEITDPAGELFIAGGTVLFEGRWDDSMLEWTALILGTFHYPPADNWLRDRMSSSLVMTGTSTDTTDSLVLEGGFSFGEHSVYLSELSWRSGCQEPSGSILLRDPSGLWFEVELAEDCTGCGTLSLDGGPTQEACLSTGAILESISARLDPR
jgi:hypothetical protein